MSKKIIFSLIAVVSLVAVTIGVSASSKSNKEVSDNNIYLFYGEGCVYCENLMGYLGSLPDEIQSKFNLVEYEVWNDQDNNNLMNKVGSHFNDEITGVPYLVIGKETFNGYAESYNEDILNAINNLESNYYDVLEEIK